MRKPVVPMAVVVLALLIGCAPSLNEVEADLGTSFPSTTRPPGVVVSEAPRGPGAASSVEDPEGCNAVAPLLDQASILLPTVVNNPDAVGVDTAAFVQLQTDLSDVQSTLSDKLATSITPVLELVTEINASLASDTQTHPDTQPAQAAIEDIKAQCQLA